MKLQSALFLSEIYISRTPLLEPDLFGGPFHLIYLVESDNYHAYILRGLVLFFLFEFSPSAHVMNCSNLTQQFQELDQSTRVPSHVGPRNPKPRMNTIHPPITTPIHPGPAEVVLGSTLDPSRSCRLEVYSGEKWTIACEPMMEWQSRHE